MKFADYRIECERRAYLQSKNPMHAWEAYGIARRSAREIPEWVLRYFDKARMGLELNVEDATEEGGTREDLARVIAKAFGLVSIGAGTPFDYNTKWWAYGRKVREFMKDDERGRPGFPLHHARGKAAKFYGVHVSTIIRGAKVYDKVFPEGDDDIFIDEDEIYVDPDIPSSLPCDDDE